MERRRRSRGRGDCHRHRSRHVRIRRTGRCGRGGHPSRADGVTGPANAILHEKVVGVQNGVPVEAEWWQETSPPYASRVIKGPVGHEGEVSDNGTTSFEYDPGTNTITEQRDSSPLTPIDPVSEVRQELASGQAQASRHGRDGR